MYVHRYKRTHVYVHRQYVCSKWKWKLWSDTSFLRIVFSKLCIKQMIIQVSVRLQWYPRVRMSLKSFWNAALSSCQAVKWLACYNWVFEASYSTSNWPSADQKVAKENYERSDRDLPKLNSKMPVFADWPTERTNSRSITSLSYVVDVGTSVVRLPNNTTTVSDQIIQLQLLSVIL